MVDYLYHFNEIVFISSQQFPNSSQTQISSAQQNKLKRDNFLYKEHMHKYLLGETNSFDIDLIISEKKENKLEVKYFIEA